MNLALRVGDQDHHHIPAVGEEIAVAPSTEADAPAPQAGSQPRANLNTAGLAELMALPGIGEVRAHSIIEHRDQNGPFRSVDELVNVSGIGWATLERLRPLGHGGVAGWP